MGNQDPGTLEVSIESFCMNTCTHGQADDHRGTGPGSPCPEWPGLKVERGLATSSLDTFIFHGTSGPG